MRSTHQPEFLPTTHEIRDVYSEEIAMLGGVVSNEYDDGTHFIARAVLVTDAEVRPGDAINGGVAIRVAGPAIEVYPYTFRQVCTNGAIVAQALESRGLERRAADVIASTYEDVLLLDELRDAIRACAAPEAFAAATRDMRTATRADGDITLQLLPALATMPREMVARVLPQILDRFAAARDRSAFGLMNAVTSLARDTDDAEMRWQLEVIGGGVPALVSRHPRTGVDAARVIRTAS